MSGQTPASLTFTVRLDLTTLRAADRRAYAWVDYLPRGTGVELVVGNTVGPYGTWQDITFARGENHHVIEAVFALLEAGLKVDLQGAPHIIDAWRQAIVDAVE